MKNNIMIMNFSGVYEMQGLKAALEKKVDKHNNVIEFLVFLRAMIS